MLNLLTISDGKPVKPEWHVKTSMFNEIWKVGGKPISSAPDADGTRHDTHMLWAPKYKRIDQCVDKTDEDWEDGLSGFRNEKQNKEKQSKIIPSKYSTFTEWCCAELEAGTIMN